MTALVVMVAPPGAGKSTFLAKRFTPSQIVCLDSLREMVSDSAHDQSATTDAVDLQHQILGFRCRRRLLTAADSTNVRADIREGLVLHAARNLMFPVAVVLEIPLEVCLRQNALREPDRVVPEHVIHRMYRTFRESMPAEGPLPKFGQTVRITPWGRTVYGKAPFCHDRSPWLW